MGADVIGRRERERRVRRLAVVAYGVLAVALVAVLAVIAVIALRASHELVIEADYSEPAIVEVEQSLIRSLDAKGFTVQTYDNGDEDIIVEKVEDTRDPRRVALGITARPVNSRQFPDVVSLGVVTKIPLLIVGRGPDGTYASPADLRGKRIQIGDYASVSADLAQRLLAAYGVTPENSTLQRDAPDVARDLLIAGDSDAAFELYSPRGEGNRSLRDLVVSKDFSLVPMPSTKALAGQLEFVDVGTLPRGAFSITADAPARDMSVILVPITVVAHSGTSTSAIYAMAQGLKEDFGRADVLASPGEFPQLSDNLPNDPEAASYYETSAVPWQYQTLPPVLADLFIPLAVAGTIFLVLASLYQVLLPEAYSLWTGVLRPSRQRRREVRAERRSARRARREETGSDDLNGP